MFDNVREDLEHARVVNGLPPGRVSLWVLDIDRDARPIRAFIVERLAPNFGTTARIERLVAARAR
jgi:hypothetical protein